MGLMKAGKEEGEAETLAIEEALDEQKKKQENQTAMVEKASSMKEKPLRKRTEDSDADEEENENDEGKGNEQNESGDEEPERVFNSQTNAMSKAREALMLSENKKMLEVEIKHRKEEEATFMYEEQLRKEQEEKDRMRKGKLRIRTRSHK